MSILSHPKDQVPVDEKCSVFYNISCSDCNASYIGQTVDHLSPGCWTIKQLWSMKILL